MKSIPRFFRPPKKSYFLFGARGSGKSTWIKLFYPEAKVIDLLEPNQYRIYRSFPERFKEFVAANTDTNVFVVDEVQKAPDLLSVVHMLIEENKEWIFVLTGSSARKLKRAGVDLLAGRAQLKHMHPFMASELAGEFDLTKSLQFGLLPLAVDSVDPKGDLKTYVALYMKEEVQMEGVVRNIEQFGRFLEAISFSQGEVINYSSIARDCYVSNKTVENYISILKDLLLCFTLSVFTKRAKRHLSSHPKFYYFDVGVYRSIRPIGPLDYSEIVNGHAVETLIAQHLRAWIAYSEQSGELFFWRTKSGLEVDFVIYGEIGFYALEVKSSNRVKNQDLKSLKEFKKDYPSCHCYLIYQGKEKLMKGDILCYPLEEFLLQLTPDKSLN